MNDSIKLVFVTDIHAHPDFNNNRADWLGKFLLDVKPDYVVNGGDMADMPSLSTYDKGKRSFVGNSYKRDIDSHLDFQERMWAPLRKSKKRLPCSIALIGNHEQRIDRALDLSPELQGTIGYKDLKLEENYDEVVYYNGQTPGITNVAGINFAHYVVSGVANRALSNANISNSLISKTHQSYAVGHNHTFSYTVQETQHSTLQGLCGGCFFDYECPWAGQANQMYWRGLTVMEFEPVVSRPYNPTFISIETLKQRYS